MHWRKVFPVWIGIMGLGLFPAGVWAQADREPSERVIEERILTTTDQEAAGTQPKVKFNIAIFATSGMVNMTDSFSREQYGQAEEGGGLDYLMRMGPAFSMVIGYEETYGELTLPTDPTAIRFKLVTTGLQFRVWQGVLFYGLSVGSYNLGFDTGGRTFKSISTGLGSAAMVGFEFDMGGFFSYQIDEVIGLETPGGSHVDIGGHRFRLGYRF